MLEGIGTEILERGGVEVGCIGGEGGVSFGWPTFLRSFERRAWMGYAVPGSIEFDVFPRIRVVKKASFFMILLCYSGRGDCGN